MPRCWPPPRSSSRSPSRPCSPSLTWRRALRRGTTSSDTRFIGAFQQTSRLQRLIERQRPCTAHAARYFELIRERLGELVADGLEEAFLVRSVRDAIRRQLESLADTGTRPASGAATGRSCSALGRGASR